MVLHLKLWLLAFLQFTALGSPLCPDLDECPCVSDGFAHNMSMVQALCQRKRLTMIPDGFPSNVRKLWAYENKISGIQRSSFENLKFLEKLYLYHNEITRIDNGTFINLEYLLDINLDHNKVSNLFDETFRGPRRLQLLSLKYNNLTLLRRGTFRFLSSLSKLALDKNQLVFIEEGTFEGLDLLTELKIAGNQLKVINKGTLGSLAHLKFLNLSMNNISIIENNAFSCLPLLESVHLNQNKLHSVPRLQQMQFLESIDLGKNFIPKVEKNYFIGLKMLSLLKLNGNNISAIQSNSFDDLENIKELFLNNNPLECDCHLRWIIEWLSGKPNILQNIHDTRCHDLGDLFNQPLLNVSVTEFLCSCKNCVQKASCVDEGYLCNCSSDWVDATCNDVCNFNSSLSSLNLTVFKPVSCSNSNHKNKSEDTIDFGLCTFNMTKETCSPNASLKIVGKNIRCICNNGFLGNGTTCFDINECSSENHKCHKGGADCLNTIGSYECSCRPGYYDLSAETPYKGQWCTDVDECTARKDDCHPNAACTNTLGSYYCTCLEGFVGDGEICLPSHCVPVVLKIDQIDLTSILIHWKCNDSCNITAYRVKYKRLDETNFLWREGKLMTSSNLTLVLTDLTATANYYIRIVVFLSHNISTESNKFYFQLKNIKRNVQVSNSSNSNEKYWTAEKLVGVIFAGLVILVLIVMMSFCILKKMRTRKRKKLQQTYPPNLEDLIETRIQTCTSQRTHGEKLFVELPALGSVERIDEWEVSREKLTLGDKVGEGEFGRVLEAVLLTETGPTKVAVKTLKPGSDRFDLKDLKCELIMMKEVGQHPNIVNLLGACTIGEPLYIIIEYISGGNLLDFLRASRRSNDVYVNVVSTLSARDLLKIALDVARGMNHIAQKKFVHRDLAARNVLLTDDGIAKICDFGLARDIYCEGQYVKTSRSRLPFKWMAPESIQEHIYTTKSDVWSFGVLLWEIVTIGGTPYQGIPVNQLLGKILGEYRMERPDHCSQDLYSVIKSCWCLEPAERPSFEVLCHQLVEMLCQMGRNYINVEVTDDDWFENFSAVVADQNILGKKQT